MTAAEMAALHARCFRVPRPWTAVEFGGLIGAPGVHVVAARDGFALGRRTADEGELLTLAVAPEARRRGTGRALLAALEAEVSAGGAATMHLEVGADNAAAIALYAAAGFAETGRRPEYYRGAEGRRVDALAMGKRLGVAAMCRKGAR